MPRGRALKNPNGYGSVVKLSGNRRNPFEVRVTTRMDERYYPVYDVLGWFPSREEALIALADYNKNPFSVLDRNMTFAQLYEKFYKNKYELIGKTYSQSSMTCTKAAYGRCSALYGLAYRKLRADDFRIVLGQTDPSGKLLSHALQNDIIEKGYAVFASITVAEDDTPGVPFTAAELQTLWKNKDIPWVDSIHCPDIHPQDH